MPKLIIASSFVLFWVFYHLSGGADFKPEARVVTSQAPFATSADRSRTVDSTAFDATYVPVETETLASIAVEEEAALTVEPVASADPTTQDIQPETPVVQPVDLDLRSVVGDRVNMRAGPGTNHRVLNTLVKGTSAEIMSTNGDGWAQIRLTETGETGWMSERLLSAD